MKHSKRALRRHHRRRMIAHARRVIRIRQASVPRRLAYSEEEMQLWALRRYDNLQGCSCVHCGHRRKWFGPPVQERRMVQLLDHSDEGWEPYSTSSPE